jgi:hypothetical protein
VNYGDSVLLMGTIGSCPLKVRLSLKDAVDVQEGSRIAVQWAAEDVHVIGTG